MTDVEVPNSWKSLADIHVTESSPIRRPSFDSRLIEAEYDQPRRNSKSWFGLITKPSHPDKERRLSRNFLNIPRKPSLSFGLNNEDGSLFANFKSRVTGRRRSSSSSYGRRKSSVAIIEEYEHFAFLPYELKGRIPPTIAKVAEMELGETHEKKKVSVVALRGMIHERTETRHWRDDEDILLMFLRAKKFDVSKAFSMLTKFYNYKTECYDAHPFTRHQFMIEQQQDYMSLLPQRDSEGRCVGIVKLAPYDPDRIPLFRGLNVIMSIFARGLEDPANQITGLVIIFDCKGMSYKWVKHMSTSYSKCLSYCLEALPIRYKAIHILNENVFFKILYKFLEVFLSQKIKSRIHLHGKDLNSLHQHVPPSILPKEYGGIDTWHTLEKFITVDDVLTPKLMT